MHSHPIHPMLVHFPIAFWAFATFLDVVNLVYPLPVEWLAGSLIVAGLIFAIPAMVAGMVDMIKVNEKSPAFKIVNQHMTFIMITWLVYGLSIYLRMEGRSILSPDFWGVFTSIVGFFCLGVAGWLGGRLVYEYGVGIDKDARKL